MNLSILHKKLVLFISFLYSFIGFSQCDGLTVGLGNDLFYCANQQVTLTATVNSTNTTTYSWTFQAAGSPNNLPAGTNANSTGVSAVQGGAGSNAQSSFATVTSTGVSGFYAGGGASGANSSAGGTRITTRSAGGGGNSTSGQESGVVNTGSGGVGFSYNGGAATYPAGAGGSGIVIVRYPK